MAHDIKHETKVTTFTEHTATISKADLVRWLKRREGLDPKNPTLRVTVTVPSGGDWSGETLDLDEVGGITVYWTEKQEE